jgi:hypothetical protein
MRSRIFILLIPTLLLTWVNSSHAYWFEYTTPEENYPIATNDTLNEKYPYSIPYPDGNTLVVFWRNYFGNCYQIYDYFGEPVFPELQPLCPGAISSYTEKLTVMPDTSNGSEVLICWVNYNQPPLEPGVWAQRLDSQGNRLWGDLGVKLYPFNSYWDVCPDGYGGCYLAISYDPQGQYYQDTWLQHITASGEAAWGDSGIVAASGPGSQRFPKVIKDDLGGVYVVWEDFRPPYTQWGATFMQRFDSTGNELWTHNGVYLCQNSYVCQLIPDEENGFIFHGNYEDPYYNGVLRISPAGEILWRNPVVSWYDDAQIVSGEPGYFYLGFSGDLYNPISSIHAQRMDMDGNCYWPDWSMGSPGAVMARFENRVYASHSSFAFRYPYFYGIYDFRHPDYQYEYPRFLYLQALDLEGNRMFSYNGSLLTYIGPTTINEQFIGVDLSPDPDGGAVGIWCTFYGWSDNSNDIYAMHVNVDGSLGGPDPRVRPQVSYPQISGVSNGAVQFTLPEAGRVELDLYNLLGRRIGVIGEDYYPSGSHAVRYDLRDLRSGVYFVRLKSDYGQAVKKVVVVR